MEPYIVPDEQYSAYKKPTATNVDDVSLATVDDDVSVSNTRQQTLEPYDVLEVQYIPTKMYMYKLQKHEDEEKFV